MPASGAKLNDCFESGVSIETINEKSNILEEIQKGRWLLGMLKTTRSIRCQSDWTDELLYAMQ